MEVWYSGRGSVWRHDGVKSFPSRHERWDNPFRKWLIDLKPMAQFPAKWWKTYPHSWFCSQLDIPEPPAPCSKLPTSCGFLSCSDQQRFDSALGGEFWTKLPVQSTAVEESTNVGAGRLGERELIAMESDLPTIYYWGACCLGHNVNGLRPSQQRPLSGYLKAEPLFRLIIL